MGQDLTTRQGWLRTPDETYTLPTPRISESGGSTPLEQFLLWPALVFSGYAGDGGQATEAHLHAPSDVAVYSRSNVYIAETQNKPVRRIDPA